MHSPAIPFTITASCIEVPVVIEKPVYNFEICVLKQIYREKLVFFNNAENSASFKVFMEEEARNFF